MAAWTKALAVVTASELIAIGKACGDGSCKGTASPVIVISMDEWTFEIVKRMTIIEDI